MFWNKVFGLQHVYDQVSVWHHWCVCVFTDNYNQGHKHRLHLRYVDIFHEASDDINLVLRVSQHSLHWSLRCLLDGLLDDAIRCRLGQTARQVDHRHVSDGHPERHAGQLTVQTKKGHEGFCSVPFSLLLTITCVKILLVSESPSLPVKLGDDFSYSLGGTCRGRDDVLVGTTAVAPGLGTGPVHSLLGGSVSVDCSLRKVILYITLSCCITIILLKEIHRYLQQLVYSACEKILVKFPPARLHENYVCLYVLQNWLEFFLTTKIK